MNYLYLFLFTLLLPLSFLYSLSAYYLPICVNLFHFIANLCAIEKVQIHLAKLFRPTPN